MAERPDRHELPDHDLSPAAFEGLGLDSLSDVRPSARQWAAIVDAADRRRPGRRPWLISAAAVLALVLGIGAVALARTGEEDVGIATSPGSAGTHLLPPADATDVTAVRLDGGPGWDGAAWAIFYTDADGLPWVLRQGLPLAVVPGGQTAGGAGTTIGIPPPGPVEIVPFGTVFLTCAGSYSVDDSGRTFAGSVGPPTASFEFAGAAAYVTRNGDPTVEQTLPCTGDDPVVGAVASLRIVDAAEFESFVGRVSETIPALLALPADRGSSTTTTQVPPNVDPAARGRIIEAFERMDERDADGGLPYVDGEDAALMARVADAGQRTEVTAPTVFTVDDIDFLTPTSASVAFTTVASLPTGPVTTRHVGAAVVVDGRWQVTRETLESLLTQAGA